MLELESHAWHLDRARGTVLVAGLGLGMFAHAAAAKAEVDRVIVVEIDADVIELFVASTDFGNSPTCRKIQIIHGDALDIGLKPRLDAALNGKPVDYLYADIWPVFPDPEAPGQTASLVKVYSPKEAGWWGQEIEYGLWCEDRAERPMFSSLEAFFEDMEIPASPTLGYLRFCETAIAANLETHAADVPGIR